MFLVLQETSPEIWKRKLDWIVRRGGMALLNVHPDYLGFEAEKTGASEYPAATGIEQFLSTSEKITPGQFWNALPREVARWYRQTVRRPANQLPNSNAAVERRIQTRSFARIRSKANGPPSFYIPITPPTRGRGARPRLCSGRAWKWMSSVCARMPASRAMSVLAASISIAPAETPAGGQADLRDPVFQLLRERFFSADLVAFAAALSFGACP